MGATAGVVPEQLATWSYPKVNDGPDAASFNMVNAMLCRIHQSGELSKISSDSMVQVKTGIRIYKESIRPHIPDSVPFYPLGFTDITDNKSPIALGMRSKERSLVAVWRLAGEERVSLPGLPGGLHVLYPTDLGIQAEREGNNFIVAFPRPYMACVLSE